MQNSNKSRPVARQKVLTGIVTSDKMDKTVVVKVTRIDKHPVYKKVIKRYSTFKAHDEKNQAKAGNTVKIMECRPISKDKRWRLLEVVQ
jgi:small subunit ribosomal protein S17